MTSFYSFNIHSQGLKNPTALIEHVIKTKPRWLLVMDGLALALQLKTASPETNVIHRNYAATVGDDDVHKRFTPQQWLDAHVDDIMAKVWIMTTCEPGWSQEVIDWHVALMRLCISRQIRLIIGNFSVGTPDVGVIAMAKPLFQLCADYPDLFVVGLHEYACAVITSGFTGGAPDGWTQAHDKQYHPDYQKASSWPLNGEARILTKWHCGRFQFIVDYCKSVGIKPPRILLTEIAFDDVSDIGWWTAQLPHTEPYKNIAGFKTLQAYWKQIFPQWSHDQAYWKQMEYAENNIYAGTVVEGGLFYCYGHKDAKWEMHDLEGRTEFLSYMEGDTVAAPLNPLYTIPDIILNNHYTITIPANFINVRKAPIVTETAPVSQLHTGDTITVIEKAVQGGEYWLHVHNATVDGWISMQGGAVKLSAVMTPTTPPIISLPPPVVIPPPPLPAPLTAYGRLYAAQSKIAQLNHDLTQAHLELALLYRELDKETTRAA